MGFGEDQALRALKANNNNVQQAIEYLISSLKSDSNGNLDDFVLVNDEEEKKKGRRMATNINE